MTLHHKTQFASILIARQSRLLPVVKKSCLKKKDKTVLELNQSKINPHMFIINNLENNVLEAEVITMIDIVGKGLLTYTI